MGLEHPSARRRFGAARSLQRRGAAVARGMKRKRWGIRVTDCAVHSVNRTGRSNRESASVDHCGGVPSVSCRQRICASHFRRLSGHQGVAGGFGAYPRPPGCRQCFGRPGRHPDHPLQSTGSFLVPASDPAVVVRSRMWSSRPGAQFRHDPSPGRRTGGRLLWHPGIGGCRHVVRTRPASDSV